jgi:integrase
VADVAVEKLGRLRQNLAERTPVPVQKEDTFAGRFDEDVRYPGRTARYRETADALLAATESQGPFENLPGYEEYIAAGDKFLGQCREVSGFASAKTLVDPSKLDFDLDVSDPLAMERAVWSDRLQVMQRTVPQELTLKSFIEQFINDKTASASAGELSAARVYALQLHLNDFADWAGHSLPVVEISGQTLSDFRLELLKKLKKNDWSRTTANDRLVTVKSFVRWLWQIEAIPALPRIMDGKSAALKIGTSSAEIVIFTKDEISTLLTNASDRTRLYTLLMLNCGMTQKDVSDLQHSEVDWEAGKITRKRSKTRKHENVPVVCYVLWSETLRLLKLERSQIEAGNVLLNENGGRILWDEVTVDGKYRKNDNIKNAFDRLRRKTNIKKPLKSLKKTSATLIRGNPAFASLESLFLGHSGKTIAHRHYAQPPQNLLDQAIRWLATEYGVE